MILILLFKAKTHTFSVNLFNRATKNRPRNMKEISLTIFSTKIRITELSRNLVTTSVRSSTVCELMPRIDWKKLRNCWIFVSVIPVQTFAFDKDASSSWPEQIWNIFSLFRTTMKNSNFQFIFMIFLLVRSKYKFQVIKISTFWWKCEWISWNGKLNCERICGWHYVFNENVPNETQNLWKFYSFQCQRLSPWMSLSDILEMNVEK